MMFLPRFLTPRLQRALAATAIGATTVGLGAVTGCNAAPQAQSVVHLAACVEDAPDQPCERLPGYDPSYWVAEQTDRTGAYLDAAELCLGALLDGQVVGRRGACTDVYDAYVADAQAGRRDLDGRLGEAQAGRALGLAYSTVVARRTLDAGRQMGGRDYGSTPLFGGDSTAR